MNTFQVVITNPETSAKTTLDIEEFIPQKGKGKGFPKLIPKGYDKWSVSTFVNTFGEARFLKVIVMPRVKALISAFSSEALTKLDKDGNEIPETDEKSIQSEYSKLLSNLSLRGDTLSELNARLDEIYENELPAAIEGLPTTMEQARALQEEVSQIRLSLSKKKKDSKRSESAAANMPIAA